jgi:TM2 domain/Protein of unknown function (DUF2510)
MATVPPAWHPHGPGQRWWDGSSWTDHFIPQVPAAVPLGVAVVGPAGERGYFDCGMGLRRWWDGSTWIGPAIAPSSIPWKSTLIAYVLLLLWGGFGTHRYYLRSTVSATVMLALWIVGAVFTFVGAVNRAQAAAAVVTATLGGGAALTPAAGAASATSVLTVGGIAAFAALALWLLIDLCTLPSLVRTLNHQRASQAIGAAAPVPSGGATLAES